MRTRIKGFGPSHLQNLKREKEISIEFRDYLAQGENKLSNLLRRFENSRNPLP